MIIAITLAVFMLAMAISLVRLVRGPSLPDRVVALDLCGSMIMAMLVVVSIKDDLPMLVDVTLVVALVAFIGTVAFSRYLERSAT